MASHSPPGSRADYSRRGFQPLNPKMSYETDIPLTTVRTTSSTGARKAGEGILASGNDFDEQYNTQDEEKKGFFKRAGGKRRGKHDSEKRKVGPDGEEVSVTALGRFYNKVVNFSVVTRYMVYVVPIALLLAVPIVLYAVLNPASYFVATGMRTYLFWAWIEIVWLSLWVSKLFAKVVPWIFMFLCGVVSSGTRKYAQILRNVEIPISLVGWAVTSLVTFTALTNPGLNGRPQQPWVSVMKNLLAPALMSSLIYFGEKVFIQLVSVNYHRRSFEGKIAESKRQVHLLGVLYDASRTLFPMYCQEFLEEDYVINDSIEAVVAKKAGHRKSGSATPMKLIADVGRIGDKVTSVFGNIASEITGKQVFNPTAAHSIVVEALEKTRSSEALAKRLWMSFVVEGKESLFAEDVEEVLGPHRKEEADEVFGMLDNDTNGDISLDEMIMKVVEIGRVRKSIASSMRDVGQAIGVLDSVLVTILFVIVIFIFVAFQNTNFVAMLATAGTTLLSLSFVFAVTTQEFLGSCIFLFIKHPYDVGDRVDIVGPSGNEPLVVEQISLLFTVFKRIDFMKTVQVPNILLNTLWIENVTRSKAMKEQLEMFISFDTSLEDIDLLRSEMEAFVRHPDNSRDFQPDLILEATGIGNMDKLQLRVEIRHKSNWANETVRAARRSKFMCALVLALRKIPIYNPGGGYEPLGGPKNPGYTVTVPDDWATEARDKASKEKEEKRLVPSPPKEDKPKDKAVPTEASESKAADALNARKPTADASELENAEEGGSSGRDDRTLGSRDTSQERKRNEDLDDLKQTLIKRESTRGRRKPGVAMPPSAPIPEGQLGPSYSVSGAGRGARGEGPGGGPGAPAFMVTRPSPRQAEFGASASAYPGGYTPYTPYAGASAAGASGVGRVIDEEAQVGGVGGGLRYSFTDPVGRDNTMGGAPSSNAAGGAAAFGSLPPLQNIDEREREDAQQAQQGGHSGVFRGFGARGSKHQPSNSSRG